MSSYHLMSNFSKNEIKMSDFCVTYSTFVIKLSQRQIVYHRIVIWQIVS